MSRKTKPHPNRGQEGSRSRGRRSRSSGPSATATVADVDAGEQRLQKVLAAAGVASRRECEQLILDGRVEVDRSVVTELGTRVDPTQHELRVDGVALPKPRRVYYLVNKPTGVVSTNRDPDGRTRVIDLVRSDQRLFTVGRLDRTSEGLILVTNDGELANHMAHPRYGVEKTYLVTVAGRPSTDKLERLRKGIFLAEGKAQVTGLNVKKRLRDTTVLEIVLNEGQNREIRRILARIGHKVLRLKRIGFGPLRLTGLPSGACRQLAQEEVDALLRWTKKPQRRRRPAKKRPAATAKPAKAESWPTPGAEPTASKGAVIGEADAPAKRSGPPKKRKPAPPRTRKRSRAAAPTNRRRKG